LLHATTGGRYQFRQSYGATKLQSHYSTETREANEWRVQLALMRACEVCVCVCLGARASACVRECVSVCGRLPVGPACENEGERPRISSPRFLNLPSSESPATSWWVESGCYRPTGSRASRQEISRRATSGGVWRSFASTKIERQRRLQKN